MSGVARETAQAFGYAITLEQLALLAEFDGDEEAIGRLTTAFCDGKSGEHVAERIGRNAPNWPSTNGSPSGSAATGTRSPPSFPPTPPCCTPWFTTTRS
jgi:hypothetical protein